MSSLELRVRRPLKTHGQADWIGWTSEPKVIGDMLKNSGLQDKTIAIETEIDPAVLSKAQTGHARLKERDMDALMDACGSEAWLMYWLLKRGYDPKSLRRIETDLETENRLLREQLVQIERERSVELAFVRNLRLAA